MTTLVLCCGALIFVLLAQCLVLCAMFGTENSDYFQLRNLGMDYRTGKASLGIQIFLMTFAGQLLCTMALVLATGQGVEVLLNIMKYIEGKHILLFFLVHVAASGMAVFAVTAGWKAKVYRFLPKIREPELSELDTDREEGAI